MVVALVDLVGVLRTGYAALLLGLALLGSAAGSSAAEGQEPPDTVVVVPDSLAVDSLVVLDSLAVGDSLGVDSAAVGDSAAVPDSVEVDSLPPPPVLPSLRDPLPAGAASGVWEWDRQALLGARGQTLAELLSGLPGLLRVRNGDYGSPTAVFSVGYSGGGTRVYWDGVEHLPMEGSVPDLSRIALSGLERVRVVRGAGGVEIHLFRRVHSDVRPHSLIEAGTGDQDTNVLRATFSLPRALGGKASLAIDRLDTQGREDPGASTGAWLRYSLHRGDRGGLRFEYRRIGSQRSDTAFAPESAIRSDWTLQGAWAIRPGAVAEAWATGTSMAAGDSLATFPFSVEGRRQYGARLSAARGALWGRATARFNGGAGVPDRVLAVEGAGLSARWGGAGARLWQEGWAGRSGSGYEVRGWFSPVSFVHLFAEHGDGSRAVPLLAPLPPPPPDSADEAMLPPTGSDEDAESEPPEVPKNRVTRRTETRLGLRLAWRGAELSGSRVSAEADSVWPTGLPFDRGGLALPQSTRSGWEATGRIPLWPRGLSLRGAVQLWDPADSTALYFPDHLYDVSLSFHRTFLASGNFEWWIDLGVQGRSPMAVPQPRLPPPPDAPEGAAPTDEEPEFVPSMVPFYQDWYFRMQLRILTLNIFVTVENLTLRPDNQDVPGRLLPGTRGLYGVRWTLWN